MYPYSVEPQFGHELFRLSDGRYQIVKRREFSNLLSGHGYVLVQKELAEVFLLADVKGVRFEQAIIYDKSSGAEWNSYYKMSFEFKFELADIAGLDLEGNKAYLMDNCYVFVSPKLKHYLESKSCGLSFSDGLSSFG
ncbi:hypothetical protein [Vibrio nigripulchritudo]|uniref:hypothetical protein n=1 Tax=Vibrio nigripulchritudo TaxID=28173 RepID=UPI0005FA75D5|nr:hypothetical protein [Vibrio nigripulchritudo]KJY66580.1 hypothetical protein TW74_27700 [Vibrio nigripulchritudo]